MLTTKMEPGVCSLDFSCLILAFVQSSQGSLSGTSMVSILHQEEPQNRSGKEPYESALWTRTHLVLWHFAPL